MAWDDTDRRHIKYEGFGDGNDGQTTTRLEERLWSKRTLVVSLIALATLLVLTINVGAWLLISRRAPTSFRDALLEDWNHCGRSSAEAMQRGCVMEPLFYGWMPKQCVYRELTDRYPVFEDRKWYLEQDMVNEVAPKALWEGENVKVYTHIYHDQHCLFQWRKAMFAINNRLPYIDNKSMSLHHTGHCADQLLQGREGEHAVNEVEIGFYQCRTMPIAVGSIR